MTAPQYLSPTQFQSTLPREERRALTELETESRKISIHAPTRGATETGDTIRIIDTFQSTLPREERLKIIRGH